MTVWLWLWLGLALGRDPLAVDGLTLDEHGAYQDVIAGRAEQEVEDLFLTGLSAALMANTREGPGPLQRDLKEALDRVALLDAVRLGNQFYLDTGALPPGVVRLIEPIGVKASRVAAELPEGLLSPVYDGLLWSPPRPVEVGPFRAGRDIAPLLLLGTEPQGRDQWALLMLLVKTRGYSLQGWSCKQRRDPVLSCEHTLLRQLAKAGPLPPYYHRRLGELDLKRPAALEELADSGPEPDAAPSVTMWPIALERLAKDLEAVLGGSWIDLGRLQGQQVLRGSLYEVRVSLVNGAPTGLRLQRKQGGTLPADAVAAVLTATLGTEQPTWASEQCGQAAGRAVRLEGDPESPRALTVSTKPCGLLD